MSDNSSQHSIDLVEVNINRKHLANPCFLPSASSRDFYHNPVDHEGLQIWGTTKSEKLNQLHLPTVMGSCMYVIKKISKKKNITHLYGSNPHYDTTKEVLYPFKPEFTIVIFINYKPRCSGWRWLEVDEKFKNISTYWKNIFIIPMANILHVIRSICFNNYCKLMNLHTAGLDV